MLSHLIQLLSLAAIVCGVFLAFGLGAGLVAGGLAGLLVGEAVDR